MVTCTNCGKTQAAGVETCQNCGANLLSLAYAAYAPLAEDIGLDRLAPGSQLTRELAEPLRELAGNHCQSCGMANRPGAVFCAYCGAAARSDTAAIVAGGLTATQAQGPGQLKPGALLRGRYRIVRKVAQGGMGAVYDVRDEGNGNLRLAIKEMAQTALSTEERTQALKDFMREATILATLDHDNLPRFDNIFSENANYYLLMEFVQGHTLESLLAQSRDFLPESRVMIWAAQLCSVLEYLHSQDPPVIYRDCKPGNIMLIDGGNAIKLIDFGIARFHRQGKVNDSIAFGTAGYAPPEQYGNGETDQRSDIYALGATLHHLLSGHDPGDNPFHWKPVRSFNPRVSRRVDNAIMRAVNMKPEERFQTVSDFALALGLQARPAVVVPVAVPVAAAPLVAVPVAPKEVPAEPVAVAPRPVRSQEGQPKPVRPAEPAGKPKIGLSDSVIDMGTSGKSTRKGRRINVVNLGGGELKGIVHSSTPWLAVSAREFSGNTADLLVTTRRRGLKTGHSEFKAPNVFNWFSKGARGWTMRLLVLAWFLLFVTRGYRIGVDSFSGAIVFGALSGLGLLLVAQIWLVIVARHVRLLVPAPKQNVGRLVIDSNGGTQQVDVRVLARPAWFRMALGWILVAAALAAELFILYLILRDLLASGILH